MTNETFIQRSVGLWVINNTLLHRRQRSGSEGGGGGGGRGEKYENLFMRSNLWYQINKFVYEVHIFGVYKHKNF